MKQTWWLNRNAEDHSYLPECRSINQSNSYTEHEPGFIGSPRLIDKKKSAKQALTAWTVGVWGNHWEDGIDVFAYRPKRKEVKMETVEMTLQECLFGKPVIFVFGSNEAGRHGAGAAKFALNHYGAQYGKGIGHYGNSYALPTKSAGLRTLHIDEIEKYADSFIAYAKDHPEYNFKVTRIGCGLAGLQDQRVAPLFAKAPENCYFDNVWATWLPEHKNWGTFDAE